MSDWAKVSICHEDIDLLDDAIIALFRAHENNLAIGIAALALRLRGDLAASGYSLKVPEPSNVVSLPDYLAQCGRLG